MELKQNKVIGGIGAILMCLFFMPMFGWALSIAGVILVLISLNAFSKLYNDAKIYSHYLISVILGAIAVLIPVVTVITFAVKNIFENNAGLIFKNLPRRMPMRQFVLPFRNWNFDGQVLNNLKGNLWIVLLVLLIFWAVLIIAGFFAKSSLEKFSEKVKDSNFKVSGMLMFIGTILLPIFGIGAILILIGFIFESIGFFSLKETNNFQSEGEIS